MNRATRAAVAAAATVAMAGTAVVVTSATASAYTCDGAKHTEKRTDPATGKTVDAKVTDCPNAGTDSSAPAPGTGGLILRDKKGADLKSGIGEGQSFDFVHCGESGSGLIYVKQTTKGTGGGWGDLYEGYVKIRYTQLPFMWKDCG